MGFKVYQIDVKSIFMNDYQKEEAFVKQLPRFEDVDHPNHMVKLDKELYCFKEYSIRGCLSSF